MRIGNFEKSSTGGRTRVSMNVAWEDSDRDAREIYIETDDRFESEMRARPDAFLLAAIMPAMQHHEKRILVEGDVCPELRNGLETAMLVFGHWYPADELAPVAIEATDGFVPSTNVISRAASFLSGGVDALATLRSNRLDFPSDHPRYIRDCFFVHGFDIGGYIDLETNRENSETAISYFSKFAENVGATLIPIITNIRHLDDDDVLFFRTFHGAALSSVAHSFSDRIDVALIASGSGVEDLGPIGSHPLIDSNYSSSRLRIIHDGVRFNRLEKVRLISSYPEELKTLRSCFDAFRDPGDLNCGKCEKCLRTMTELYVVGKLSECPTYPHDELTAEMLEVLVPDVRRQAGEILNRMSPDHEGQAGAAAKGQIRKLIYISLNIANNHYWRELLDPLRHLGRHDLADVITRKLTQYDEAEQGNPIRRFASTIDQKYFGSRISRIKKKFAPGT